MNPATAPSGLSVIAFANQFANSVLTIYSGTQPATPETALSGNTALVAFTFASPAFTDAAPTFSAGFNSIPMTFTSSTATPTASGTATFARATAVATSWVISHPYTRGTLVTNSSKLYVCTVSGTSAGSGGPTTSVHSIADGTAVWDFIGASTVAVLADFTVGTSATDIIVGSTALNTGTSVTISSFNLQVAAS